MSAPKYHQACQWLFEQQRFCSYLDFMAELGMNDSSARYLMKKLRDDAEQLVGPGGWQQRLVGQRLELLILQPPKPLPPPAYQAVAEAIKQEPALARLSATQLAERLGVTVPVAKHGKATAAGKVYLKKASGQGYFDQLDADCYARIRFLNALWPRRVAL